jgi:3-methyladenine DNA glycosylase/8-oxoguanine DNA glycosylase
MWKLSKRSSWLSKALAHGRHYIALKALRDADSLPSTDLILGKALKVHSREALARMSLWRAYIAALLWRNAGSANEGVNALTYEER